MLTACGTRWRPSRRRAVADAPVVHLPDRDYHDDAIRRDWRKQGFAVTPEFGGHPVREQCPKCTGEPPAEAEPADATLESLLAELSCLVHPAGEAGVLAVARRIFRYGTMTGWDRAVAAAEPAPPRLAYGAQPHPDHGHLYQAIHLSGSRT